MKRVLWGVLSALLLPLPALVVLLTLRALRALLAGVAGSFSLGVSPTRGASYALDFLVVAFCGEKPMGYRGNRNGMEWNEGGGGGE